MKHDQYLSAVTYTCHGPVARTLTRTPKRSNLDDALGTICLVATIVTALILFFAIAG